ncbi:hypothetical protein BOO94_16180 [Pseudomonas sp. FSL W5-0299]|nr:hypothetical protein BOO94_16180 [Pseudomonas sp. FSL W5-0299]
MTDSISKTAVMIKLYRECGEGGLLVDRVAAIASRLAPARYLVVHDTEIHHRTLRERASSR